jgi:hypothetical protein
MPAPLKDVEALFDAVKHLRDERRKMERLSEKAMKADAGPAYQKAVTNLNWQAHHVVRLEHTAHAAAVDCGLADLREPDHYRPYTVKLTGFHEYEVKPCLPLQLSKGGA